MDDNFDKVQELSAILRKEVEEGRVHLTYMITTRQDGRLDVGIFAVSNLTNKSSHFGDMTLSTDEAKMLGANIIGYAYISRDVLEASVANKISLETIQ